MPVHTSSTDVIEVRRAISLEKMLFRRKLKHEMGWAGLSPQVDGHDVLSDYELCRIISTHHSLHLLSVRMGVPVTRSLEDRI